MENEISTVLDAQASIMSSHRGTAQKSSSASARGNSRRSKNNNSESARDALLRVMVDTIDEHGEPGVRLERVLRDADASVSSMYHHFGNLGGLIEAAQIIRFRRTLQVDLDFLREGLQAVTNIEEFRGLLISVMDRVFDSSRRIVRSQRVNAAARSYQNPEYAERLQNEQRETNKAIALVLLQAQAKDFIPSDVDVDAVAAWWTSSSYSRYFIEILNDPSMESRWDDMAKRLGLSLVGITY